MSAFQKWFEQQHGPRPHLGGLDQELVEQVNRGLWAEEQLRKRQEYDVRQQSALYAWNARVRLQSSERAEPT